MSSPTKRTETVRARKRAKLVEKRNKKARKDRLKKTGAGKKR